MLDIKYHFTCGDSDVSQIIKKCQNIMTIVVWKIYFALYSLSDDSIFWKSWQFWLKNVSSFRKQPIDQVESFLKSNFDLNQWYKILLTQNHQILKLLTFGTDLLYILMMIGERLWSYSNIQNMKCEGDWAKLR